MIIFVCAYAAEARPLIDHYRLRRLSAKAFTCYSNTDDVYLIVSGPGKISAAASCGYIHGSSGFLENALWINLGIAGHATAEIGSAYLAHKITDPDQSLVFYPPLISPKTFATSDLLCLSQAENDYPEKTLIDMESSGFYQAATRFSSGELIQCLKIVSDNRENPMTAPPKSEAVQRWIQPHLDAIARYAATLEQISLHLQEDEELYNYRQQLEKLFRFSTTQQAQLVKLLRRFIALDLTELPKAKSPGDFLEQLSQLCTAQKFHL